MTTDDNHVICPNCVHQFVAIPESVQKLMLDAGFEPPFTTPPQHTEQNFCPRCGKRTNDIHTCTPPQRTEQEPVAYWKEHAQGLQHDYDSLLAEFQAQRTWVGLTDEEHSKCWHSNPDKAIKNIEAKLKEKNNA